MASETEIKPKKRKKWLWIVGGILLLIFIIAIATGGEKKETTSGQQFQQAQISQSPRETEKEVVFNIPSLIRKNISEVKNILGKPVNEYDPGYGGTLPTVIYQKNGYELQIDYLSSTGDVAEIFLAKNTNSKNELFNAGNLDENSVVYSIKLQPSLQPDIVKYTGVHIYRWK